MFKVSIKDYKERKKRLVNEDPLIEVYRTGKKGKNKLRGYVDKSFNFLGSNKKLWASIEDDVILFWNKEPVYHLKDNEAIYDYNNELMGTVKDFKIYDKEGILLYKFSKNSGEIEDINGRILYVLKGNLDVIDHLTLVGFAFAFLDLFC